MGVGSWPEAGRYGGYAPALVTPPAVLPVSLAEAKLHLRVDASSEDDLIDLYLQTAVDYLDGYSGLLGKAIITQTWRQTFDDFLYPLRLPLVASSITSLTYVNTAGSTVTLDSASYVLRRDALGSYVEPVETADWPATGLELAAVNVTFVSGAALADVPAAIRTLILLLVGGFYANRESAGPIALPENGAVGLLIARHRKASL